MNIRNCTSCGKIYNYDGLKTCINCRKADEKDYEKVRDYLHESPGANISEVSEATEVDSGKIIAFLREGRLEVEAGGNLILECEKCGVSITTGRFCNKCTSDLQRELGQVVTSARPNKSQTHTKEKDAFRVVDRYKDKR